MAHPVQRLASFLSELSRRKVYRGTALYVVAAVGGLELVDTLVPITPLPSWSAQAFLIGAVIGLPIVAILSWTYDVTSRGVVATGPEEIRPEPPGGGGPVAAEARDDLNLASVAVLPFENLGGVPAAQPFVLGLQEDILTELSRASALTVISRSSTRGFSGGHHSPKTVGRELGVGTVVEGSLQMMGQRARLNIRVVDTRSESQLWADRFEFELTTEDLFTVQRDIAQSILGALEAHLTVGEVARSRVRPAGNIAAYQAYVRGYTRTEAWDEDGIREGVRYLMEATELDPDYAPAWAKLADALTLLRWYNHPPVPEAPDPQDAVRRALQLDAESAEAHCAQGIILSSREIRDGPRALQAFERAIHLRPGYAYAQVWLGWMHLLLGDPEAALGPARRSAEIDPLSAPARVFLSEVYLATRSYGPALAEAVRGRTLQPGKPLAHLQEAIALHHVGRYEEAVDAAHRALDILPPGAQAPRASQVYGILTLAAAAMGEEERAKEFASEVEGDEDRFAYGLTRAGLGSPDAALLAWRRVADWGQFEVEILRYFYPDLLGPLRADPRYADLLTAADRSWGLRV